MTAGHSQVNLNINIEIYVTSPHIKKESLVKGFLSDDTPCLQMHASKQYTITNTKPLHNSQLVMFK